MNAAEERISAYLAGLAKFGWHLGLDRIEALLERLGHPERSYLAVQVAGTNGKGSTAAHLAYILAAAGYKAGLYISPHLESYRERFALVGPGPAHRLIDAERLADLLGEVAAAAGPVAESPAGPPTEFEVLTGAAARWFAEERAQVVVWETGLGGRLDATTACPSQLSVLTHIDLDHQDRLGPTLEAIAAEKAAIVRPGQPVVVAPQEPAAMAVIAARAAEQGSPLLQVDEAVVQLAQATLAGTEFTYRPPAELAPGAGQGLPARLATALLGPHQAINAAVAVTAALALEAAGLRVSPAAVERGLAEVRWPGRLEVLRREPLVIVDGAHNPDGMRRLVEAWRALAPGAAPLVVCGFLRDKAWEELVALLAGLAGEVVVTRPASDRAAAPGEVAELFRRAGVPAQAVEPPEEAAREALAHAREGGRPLLGCGSLYLIGALRRAWRPAAGGKGGEVT
ncbi:MAG: bifunctional folylpolyglutamate synthase/dihydrofolate synthase [Chitinophagales bacterium]